MEFSGNTIFSAKGPFFKFNQCHYYHYYLHHYYDYDYNWQKNTTIGEQSANAQGFSQGQDNHFDYDYAFFR